MADTINIVAQEHVVLDFAGRHLVVDETYMIYLAFRWKYVTRECKEEAGGASFGHQLECCDRTLFVYKDPFSFLRLVRKFEVRRDCYMYNDGAVPPAGSSALYISMSPVDQKAAFINVFKTMSDIICDPGRIGCSDLQKIYKSEVQRSSKRRFVSFDVDTLDKDRIARIVNELHDMLKSKEILVIFTHGGAHIHVPCALLRNNPLAARFVCHDFPKINKDVIDNGRKNNLYSPVPGTYQGKHVVFFQK